MKGKKITALLLTAAFASAAAIGLAACGGDSTPTGGGDNSGLKTGGWNDFTHTYTDNTGAEVNLAYSLYVPTVYDGKKDLPLVTYIPDATISAVARTKTAQCPKYWKGHDSSLILILTSDKLGNDPTDTTTQGGQIVPIIDKLCQDYAIDSSRLYLTGQSKGGIYDFALNEAYPTKFAATVYVSCQMGGDVGDAQYNRILQGETWANQNFVYIASKLDEKAPYGQKAIMDALDAKGADYGYLTDLDHKDISATSDLIKAELDKGNKNNIFQFKQVTANGDGAQEHMQGFQYGYMVDSIYDWLMAQKKA